MRFVCTMSTSTPRTRESSKENRSQENSAPRLTPQKRERRGSGSRDYERDEPPRKKSAWDDRRQERSYGEHIIRDKGFDERSRSESPSRPGGEMSHRKTSDENSEGFDLEKDASRDSLVDGKDSNTLFDLSSRCIPMEQFLKGLPVSIHKIIHQKTQRSLWDRLHKIPSSLMKQSKGSMFNREAILEEVAQQETSIQSTMAICSIPEFSTISILKLYNEATKKSEEKTLSSRKEERQ